MKGFTLIEVMVIAVIVAILAAVAIPACLTFQIHTDEAAAKEFIMSNKGQALRQYETAEKDSDYAKWYRKYSNKHNAENDFDNDHKDEKYISTAQTEKQDINTDDYEIAIDKIWMIVCKKGSYGEYEKSYISDEDREYIEVLINSVKEGRKYE